MELEVKVININEGRNEEIVSRCRMLYEYGVLMARIRFYKNEQNSLEEAVEKAVIFCEKHGILKEYLEIHGSEVLNMILTEWNTEDAIAFAREEGREEGSEDERLMIVRNLLAKGLTPEFISETTGLSMDEIKKL